MGALPLTAASVNLERTNVCESLPRGLCVRQVEWYGVECTARHTVDNGACCCQCVVPTQAGKVRIRDKTVVGRATFYAIAEGVELNQLALP